MLSASCLTRLRVRQNPKHMICNVSSKTHCDSISQIPHTSFSRESDTGRQILAEKFPFLWCNHLSLEKSHLIIKSTQLLWFSILMERWFTVQKCWNLYWILNSNINCWWITAVLKVQLPLGYLFTCFTLINSYALHTSWYLSDFGKTQTWNRNGNCSIPAI